MISNGVQHHPRSRLSCCYMNPEAKSKHPLEVDAAAEWGCSATREEMLTQGQCPLPGAPFPPPWSTTQAQQQVWVCLCTELKNCVPVTEAAQDRVAIVMLPPVQPRLPMKSPAAPRRFLQGSAAAPRRFLRGSAAAPLSGEAVGMVLRGGLSGGGDGVLRGGAGSPRSCSAPLTPQAPTWRPPHPGAHEPTRGGVFTSQKKSREQAQRLCFELKAELGGLNFKARGWLVN